jgi:hypothetical protein
LSETQEKGEKFKVPAEVARIMKQWGGHQVKLAAARGSLPMSGANLVTVLFIFCHGTDEELKKEALQTLKGLSPAILTTVCTRKETHPQILDLIARLHYRNMKVMEPLLKHTMVSLKTLLFVAEHASGDVLDLLASNDTMVNKSAALRTLIINNPHAEKVLKLRLGWQEEVEDEPEPQDEAADNSVADSAAEPEDEENQSKYQQLLVMPVAEKIKMALTGDKEWRTLLIRESNKLVSSAVLKNPRITEGEVLMVAKSRTSSEELIRLILLNRDWTKLYDMKKALVEHPRTPLLDAMRFMSFLSEKDLRDLAKSRNVTQAISNNARRILMSKKR